MIVFSHIPRPARMAVLAIAAAVATLSSAYGLTTLAVLGFVGMALALTCRRELRVAPARRTYFWCDGIWPLMGTRRGSFEDFRWVVVEAIPTVSDQTGASTHAYTASIEWDRKLGMRPFVLSTGSDFNAIASRALETATAIDTSVVENLDLKKLRPTLGPAAYDPRLIVPMFERPASLAARLRG